MNECILVVDDEPTIRDVVERYLQREGYRTLTAADGEEALERAPDADLIVLDLMLPRVDGIEVCRRVRAENNVPIIMLTAKSEEIDKLLGLRIGADDYLTKPFSPAELVARVQAVLRRSVQREPAPGDSVTVGTLKISPKRRTVESSGQPIDLTAREFDLLSFLAANPGQVFTREQLLDHVWDFTFPGDTGTVTVHVRRLREKIEPDPVRPRYIKTVWGVDYKLETS
ncbi:MAG TPA: response regulator transcription factor [Chloroflexota bacterium]|nr:response regulator transcription factor [Chloroflexota bacterium]